jgi:hypothetical protein
MCGACYSCLVSAVVVMSLAYQPCTVLGTSCHTTVGHTLSCPAESYPPNTNGLCAFLPGGAAAGGQL